MFALIVQYSTLGKNIHPIAYEIMSIYSIGSLEMNIQYDFSNSNALNIKEPHVLEPKFLFRDLMGTGRCKVEILWAIFVLPFFGRCG